MARTHKTFTTSGTWVCPAGVTEIQLIGMYGMPGGPGGGGGGGGCNGTADIVFNAQPAAPPVYTITNAATSVASGIAQSFTVASTVTCSTMILPLVLNTGTAAGHIDVAIVNDNSGAPTGSSVFSTTVTISTLKVQSTVGVAYVTITVSTSLPAGNYWVTLVGDSTFLAGNCQVGVFGAAITAQGTVPYNPQQFITSTTTWTTFSGAPMAVALTTAATANGGGGSGGIAGGFGGEGTYSDVLQYAPSIITVTPNTSYTVTIGAGGAGGVAGTAGPIDGMGANGQAGGEGGDSIFKNGTAILWQSSVASSGQISYAGGTPGLGGESGLPSSGGSLFNLTNNGSNFGGGGDPATLIANSGISVDDIFVGSTETNTAGYLTTIALAGVFTAGSNVVINLPSTEGLVNGWECVGDGGSGNIIPYPTTITSFTSSTITLSNNALLSGYLNFVAFNLSASPNTTPSVAGTAGTTSAGEAGGGGGWGGLSSGPSGFDFSAYSFPPQNGGTTYNKGGNGGNGGNHGAVGSAGSAGTASTVGNLVGGAGGGSGGGGSTGKAAGAGGAGGAGSSGFIILAWDE